MKSIDKKKHLLNKDYLAKLFCQFVVVVTLVLIVINGIKFIKFLFYLIEKEILQQSTQSSF